jgi:hypothetical protein
LTSRSPPLLTMYRFAIPQIEYSSAAMGSPRARWRGAGGRVPEPPNGERRRAPRQPSGSRAPVRFHPAGNHE